ncbi:MAG: isoleucine--tRNA ligase [Bacillota bacterium]
MDYGKTLNLPQTNFPMRANLPVRETEIQKRWEEIDLYNLVQAHRAGAPRFVLHDGPPYANGPVHIGTAMNKVLKDVVVKYKTMRGFESPYVPGWDTHGLPIEHAAIKQLQLRRHEISPLELREKCAEWALQWVDHQRQDFERLGVRSDWKHPYLTLRPEYEARQLDIFAAMVEKGLIYKGQKPVYWCPVCETALAEAEIEYADAKSPSIYVRFQVVDDPQQVFPDLGKPIYYLIWTTTPWTLPANVAIALNEKFEYALVDAGDFVLVMAKDLVENVCQAIGLTDYEVGSTFMGQELEGMSCQHPFIADRRSLIILGNHVTLEAGTGCVHTAPGHGVDDFIVGSRYQLPVINPVDNSGVFTEEAGKFAGMRYDKANPAILEELSERGALLGSSTIRHSYPHCWRCKQPIVFRATEQWFASVEGIRDEALQEITNVRWYPRWGEQRISNMVKDRGDWCISRQRSWGVPIPAFYCRECGKELLTPESIAVVRQLFAQEGSNAWFRKSADEILQGKFQCSECGHDQFEKETDIMDVWFDSGSSHWAVADRLPELGWPVDLYLEGSDQHRGWFQSSLLTAVAAQGQAPYRAVLTHGFVLDGQGRKMSKSLGNVVAPGDVVKQFGADILRLWVASTDFKSDVHISNKILQQMSEAYRKIRNTVRYLLGNLYDFDPTVDQVAYSELTELDRWALHRLAQLVQKVTEGYEEYDFHVFYHAVHNFCAVDMSAFYLDVIKDRIYASAPASVQRRAAQTVLWECISTLVRLIAPVLTHTADEIWSYLPQADKLPTVQLADWPQVREEHLDYQLAARWDKILTVRGEVAKALEQARRDKVIGSSLDAHVDLYPSAEWVEFVSELSSEWPMLCIVSQVTVHAAGEEVPTAAFQSEELPGFAVAVQTAAGEKCERCWNHSEAVGEDETHPTVCPRCASVLRQS